MVGKKGRIAALSSEEEKEVVRCCQILADFGLGFTRDLVGLVIRQYLQEHQRDFVCGRDAW
eukprot:m.259359 g.259359  ORF g.259359 m.259359 type:complete len:61 (+) comp40416_c0_seq13:948-1130(+)